MPSFSSLITVCFLSAFCSLSAQAAPSTTSHAIVAVSNPYSLGPFAPGSTAFVTAESHASFTQKVTITGPPAVCTLQGSGEGRDMTVPGTTSTQCSFEPVPTSDSLTLSVLFQFSPTGSSGPFSNTPVVASSTNTLGIVTSVVATTEDSTNDDNDSIVTITVISLGPGENAATAAAVRGTDAAVAVQLPRRGKSAAHYLSLSTARQKAQIKLGKCSYS
ncbi:hypothetical protein B0H13DRAFT_1883670 [Mycena leptocephala]|nr:hypothetical protein B0H13DRAFT_1883670 [Mycena leptocephala]